MTPTQKQIAEVTHEAISNNYSIQRALSTLNNSSASIYKAIGAKGIVEASIEASDKIAVGIDYVVYAHCGMLGNENGNEFLSYNGVEFWLPKTAITTINGITCFHAKYVKA